MVVVVHKEEVVHKEVVDIHQVVHRVVHKVVVMVVHMAFQVQVVAVHNLLRALVVVVVLVLLVAKSRHYHIHHKQVVVVDHMDCTPLLVVQVQHREVVDNQQHLEVDLDHLFEQNSWADY